MRILASALLAHRRCSIKESCLYPVGWGHILEWGGPQGALLGQPVPFPSSPAPDPSPAALPSPGAVPLLGISLPKFTWQEGRKRLPLIGCVLLLIVLVVALIILREFNRGSRGRLWSRSGGMGSAGGGTLQGDGRGEHTHSWLPCPTDTPAKGCGPRCLQAPLRLLG